MASIEARLGELLAENRSLRQWLTDEAQARKLDHDRITQLEGGLATANDKIEELERFERAVGDADKKRLEAKISEKVEEGKEGRSRRWQIIVEIVGALVAALIGGAVAKWIFS